MLYMLYMLHGIENTKRKDILHRSHRRHPFPLPGVSVQTKQTKLAIPQVVPHVPHVRQVAVQQVVVEIKFLGVVVLQS